MYRFHVLALVLFLIWPYTVHADDGKLAVPTDAVQREALALVQEIYGEAFDSAKTDEQKQALARELLDKALESQDPTSRYVLLKVARNMATQGAHGLTAFRAVDEMGRTFQIDAVKMKASVLHALSKKARPRAHRKSIAAQALAVVEEAVAGDNFELAEKLIGTALSQARKARDGELVKKVAALSKELKEIKKRYLEVEAAARTLEENPVDPDANLLVGIFRCFMKGDWENGLPMLALGSNATLKALAVRELEGVSKATKQVKLADGWWELAEKEKGLTKKRIQDRALYWYGKAFPRLTGLLRNKVEKRIVLVETERSPTHRVVPGNVARAGAWVEGVNDRVIHLFDGEATKYNSGSGYASSPIPCEWIIRFDRVYKLQEIRFLLYDKDRRYYRYTVAVSSDSRKFTPLVDRSRGEWRSWQQIRFRPRPVKAIKLIGLYNSKNKWFHVVEFEAYCIPPKE